MNMKNKASEMRRRCRVSPDNIEDPGFVRELLEGRSIEEIVEANPVATEEFWRGLYLRHPDSSELIRTWRLPEDVKDDILARMLSQDGGGWTCSDWDRLYDFMRFQHWLPCQNWLEAIWQAAYRYAYGHDQRHRASTMSVIWYLQFMKAPVKFGDDEIEKMLDEPERGCLWMLKLAANPSVSDFCMMQLRLHASEWELDEELDEVLSIREKAREEYRRGR